VGDDGDAGALIMQNVGSGWSVVSNPPWTGDPDLQPWILRSVTCVSTGDCWAVGGSVIEQNVGSGWNIVQSPTFPSDPVFLDGVTCMGADDCWAVGSYGTVRTLTLQETGSRWSVVASPNVATPMPIDDVLMAVTCENADDCWAVGSYMDTTTGSAMRTLIEQSH
jgi:hypothetical protein